MAYVKRAAEDTILRISNMFPVLLATGPRQAGKTTLLQKLAESQKEFGIERKYVTLEDPDARYLAKHEPALFMQIYEPPVLIDEIQYAAELLPYIKMNVDCSKQKGSFWLAGSHPLGLMKNVQESLAGYVGIVNLLGLSDSEIYQTPSEPFAADSGYLIKRLFAAEPRSSDDIYQRIFKGSMPELYADETVDQETYHRSYVEKYLQRDIRGLAEVADEMQFYNFMTIAAAYTSKTVIYEELANAVGISVPTAEKWLSILESSHIIALIPPYQNKLLKRLVNMPLLHFLDTGLAAFLLKWDNPQALEQGAMSEAFLKSHVFSEIYKSYLNAGKEPPFFYYKDKDENEIDMLIDQNGELSPIGITKAVLPDEAAVKNFHVLDPVRTIKDVDGLEMIELEIGTGIIVCMANKLTPVDDKNWYVPVWLL